MATSAPPRPATRRSSAAARADRRRRRRAWRRRVLKLATGAVVAVVLAILAIPLFETAVKEVALPLRHADIVRQQASDKGVDAALIAAVIYAESRFVSGRTSSAGAQGLMQVTPPTAQDIARRSGATNFVVEDLDDPQVNISYGTFYLEALLERYEQIPALALAAYNAGQGNVDRWLERDPGMKIDEIPFPETREYVKKVLDARRDYRANYADELGL